MLLLQILLCPICRSCRSWLCLLYPDHCWCTCGERVGAPDFSVVCCARWHSCSRIFTMLHERPQTHDDGVIRQGFSSTAGPAYLLGGERLAGNSLSIIQPQRLGPAPDSCGCCTTGEDCCCALCGWGLVIQNGPNCVCCTGCTIVKEISCRERKQRIWNKHSTTETCKNLTSDNSTQPGSAVDCAPCNCQQSVERLFAAAAHAPLAGCLPCFAWKLGCCRRHQRMQRWQSAS